MEEVRSCSANPIVCKTLSSSGVGPSVASCGNKILTLPLSLAKGEATIDMYAVPSI
jgi:hypothetical protein